MEDLEFSKRTLERPGVLLGTPGDLQENPRDSRGSPGNPGGPASPPERAATQTHTNGERQNKQKLFLVDLFEDYRTSGLSFS